MNAPLASALGRRPSYETIFPAPLLVRDAVKMKLERVPFNFNLIKVRDIPFKVAEDCSHQDKRFQRLLRHGICGHGDELAAVIFAENFKPGIYCSGTDRTCSRKCLALEGLHDVLDDRYIVIVEYLTNAFAKLEVLRQNPDPYTVIHLVREQEWSPRQTR
jgi:hypothetical protein